MKLIKYSIQSYIQIISQIENSKMKQARTEQQQEQDNFKVAPIISDQKLSQFKLKVVSTVLGLATVGHYDGHGHDQNIGRAGVMALVLYFLAPIGIVVPSTVIVEWRLHALAVLIPVVVNTLLALLADIVVGRSKIVHRYVMTAVYSYLWAVHFFISRQLLQAHRFDIYTYSTIMILSIITLLTSSNTVVFAPVREFSASTFDYQQFGVHSTLYVRLYAVVPILVTQLGLYYSTEAGIGHPALPVLQYVAALTFPIWILGWISSLYNNIMFWVNNMMNGLVFGQQLSHSGNNYRGDNMWWTSILIFVLNVLAIGANLLMIALFRMGNEPEARLVESQHVLLVFLAALTSVLSSAVLYFSYRCSEAKRYLVRFNKFDLTQVQVPGEQAEQNSRKRVYKGSFFFGHKQTFMLLTNLLVPTAVSVISVFGFAPYYGGYNAGQTYEHQTNFQLEKAITYIVLAINSGAYLFFVLFKEITRVRSKIGCAINMCCFDKYYAEIERDMYIKIILKFTGALAVMVLVLRIQNLLNFPYYIMQITPVSQAPNPTIAFFITDILLPILIYRSYKRAQTFSHFFHITIIISFILTVADSTLYFYESILVVLAFPNFPENPFRLLLLSPFTVPQKLLHKREGVYRVGYLLVNFVTFFLYVASLGTLEFTMIFGLPMYWCVIPSISCQAPKSNKIKPKPLGEQSIKNTMSDFEMTNQSFNTLKPTNRATPEHNLYQKIVSEIPFYIFRNKRPGYYLLRVSKYILLVEVVMDFYGIFETVTLIGLQTQEVTTCHAKQGETIDRMVEYTWSDNPGNLESCACHDVLRTVVHEEHCVKNVKITGENEIQLTGVIQSAEFYQLFKKCLIASIVFNYNLMLKKNGRNQLTGQQVKDAEVLLDDLQGRIGKDKIDEFFPYSFMSQAKNNLVFAARFKQLSPSKILIKKKLPPISKKDDKKKEQIIDDFADLIGGASNTSNLIHTGAQQKAQKVDIDKLDEQSIIKQNNNNTEDKKQMSELHMAVIVSAYLAVLGKINYLNPERLYKMMKKDVSVLSQFQFKGGLDLVAASVGSALKIAIGKQLMGENQIDYSDFVQYQKNQFLGTLESAGFSQAIEANKQDIWTVSYNQTKKLLSVKRLARSEISLYMFSFQNHAVQAVWNNLRFELLFATNDNDERYSIQTHPFLLRNLLVEACEEPYGYAGYYSQQFLNL